MIGLRLDRLDPRVIQVLNLAAVAGSAATLPVLVDASGLEGDDLLDATDVAVAAGLLVEDGAGRLSVPHALIGQAIRARLGRTRRLDLHRRVAAAIEQSSDRQSAPAVLAHHLFEAGSLVDRDTRIAAGLRAGRRSVDVGAYEDAASWADRVEGLVTDQVGARDRAVLALLRSDLERCQGDRAKAIAAARDGAVWARRDGDPMLLASAAESWMMSLSGVGFDIGMPADGRPRRSCWSGRSPSCPPDLRRYQVRMRSMLASVLVPDPDPTRRVQLADEAMAIAAVGDESELVASALLARRLAWWQLDRLDERTAVVLDAVRHAHDAGNVHLELTAMLFAMSDLLEQGRMAEHLAMLDEFTARADELHVVLFQVYGMFQRASHALSAGDYAEARRLADAALAAGRRSHGVNAEVAYAGVWFRLALDLGTLPATLRRERAHVRRQPPPADVADRRRPRPRRRRPPRRRTGPLRGPRRSRRRAAARQPDVPARHVHAGRGGGGDRRSASGPPSCAARSSRTPRASPPAGWPGSRSDRSATTSGWPPRRPATSPLPPRSSGRPSSATSATAPAHTRPGPTARWAACCAPRGRRRGRGGGRATRRRRSARPSRVLNRRSARQSATLIGTSVLTARAESNQHPASARAPAGGR